MVTNKAAVAMIWTGGLYFVKDKSIMWDVGKFNEPFQQVRENLPRLDDLSDLITFDRWYHISLLPFQGILITFWESNKQLLKPIPLIHGGLKR